jgi:hypothetical protein
MIVQPPTTQDFILLQSSEIKETIFLKVVVICLRDNDVSTDLNRYSIY